MTEEIYGVLSNAGTRGGQVQPREERASGNDWKPPLRKFRLLTFEVARSLEDGEAVLNTLDLSRKFELSV